MTNEEMTEQGFRAGVKAYHEKSPYELEKTIKSIKRGAWGMPDAPYLVGYLQGVGEMQNPAPTQKG